MRNDGGKNPSPIFSKKKAYSHCEQASNFLSKSGKLLYKFRKEKMERSFADSKRAEEAPGPPRGKRVPGAEINRPVSRANLLLKNCREIYPFSTI
jgi:hypothetical protein